MSSVTATSGIDLSAILQAATGAASSGIDVTSAVAASVAAARAPETNWQNQITTLQSQATALTQIQTDATNLDNDVLALNSLTGPLSARTVTSSNTGVVSASAASGSTIGNNVVVVNSLATAASWSSTEEASATTALPAETITITPASGTATTITTGSGVNNLTELAAAINGTAGLGVSASVITDATGSRLAITSNTSGSASNFTVSSSDSSFALTQAVPGANAALTVNGIAISSASNTVQGAIPGVTLNLESALPGTQVTLAVAPDTSSAATAISQFVADYNIVIGDLNTTFAEGTNGQGVLADDPTVRNLQSELLGTLSYAATPATGTTTTVPNLSSLGISVNGDGTLSVDSTTLSSTLQNNFSDVQNFFQGSALNGFANNVDQQLSSFINPGDGAFTVDLSSNSTEQSSLQTEISDFETNIITPLQTQLQAEFSDAEIALQQLPNELKDVDAELGINQSTTG